MIADYYFWLKNKVKHMKDYYFEYWSEKEHKWMFEKGTIAPEDFLEHLKRYNMRFVRKALLDNKEFKI